MDATAARRGTPVGLGARVLPTLEGSRKMGLDVPAWLSAGLLDYVAKMFEQNEHLDPDLPFEETAALARQHGCFVYPAVRPFRYVGFLTGSTQGDFFRVTSSGR